MKQAAVIRELRKGLEHIMRADVAWCAAQLESVERRLAVRKPTGRMLQRVVDRMSESAERRARRSRSLPQATYDSQLPISAHRQEIITQLQAHPVLIVAGETGSGKTTQLPKLCLEAGLGIRGLIGCTQPRRIAARAMAARVAEELNCEVGAQVGYQVRFRERVSADSYIKFMTDGILLAETLHDPALDAYDTIIIDEAHERSLNIDFLLGYLKRLLPRRPDLKLVITSATIDTAKFSSHFDGAPVIEVSGRGHPVEIVYQPIREQEAGGGGNRNLYLAIADAIGHVGRIDPRGDILVFLSGEREIREARDYLERSGLRHTEILPLYARLSAAEQHRVFHPGALRRVILSTNVAETSLTVPRIRFVIDSGFARISRYAHRSRIQRLPIEPISQASANQRAGRCGRLGPGTCVRLYDREDFDLRPEYTEPEILRTSLAAVILRMATMDLGAVEEFPFIDPPAPRMIADAYHLLYELGALDAQRQPTDLGRRMVRWPLDVRLARMVLESERQQCLEDLLVLAAGLSIQDPRERPLDAQAAADEAHARFHDERSDFNALLKLWRYLREQRHSGTGNQFRKLCRREYLNWQRVLEWFDLTQQLRDQAREERMALTGRHGSHESVHKALLAGLLSHVGQRHPEQRQYLGARNRSFVIFPGSGLFGRTPGWLMAAEIVETTRTYARTVAAIEPAWLELLAGHLLKRHYRDPHWSVRGGRVMAWEQVSLFGLVIVERRRVPFAPVDPVEARRLFILHALVRGELGGEAAFLDHNARLRADLEAVEHKRRARDVLVDEGALCRWFEARVPPDVNGRKSLRAWLASAGDGVEESLRLGRDDLLREDAEPAPRARFPDHLESRGQTFALSYLFAPGDPADGITVAVPLALLNTLDAGGLEWLVPGYLEEKISALIRSLPKPLRRACAPAPQFAAAAMEQLPEAPAEPLSRWLAGALGAATGARITAGDFDPSALPDHLRFRFCLTDEAGHELATDRDLERLQRHFGDRAQRRFMDQQGSDWNRDGATDWGFGALPASVVAEAGVRAWPAVVDQVEAVGVRLFDDPGAAAHAHHQGLMRLLSIALADKLRDLKRHHGLSIAAQAAWAPRGEVASLVDDLLWYCLGEVCAQGIEAVRDGAAFEARASDARQRLGAEFRAHVRVLGQVLECCGRAQSLLAGVELRRHEAACADVRSQLDDLVYPGFLTELEAGRLEHFPRYLHAALERLERLSLDPNRDQRLMAQVLPHWQRYLQHLEAGHAYDEALDGYRWLLHEFRVSLFAQTLGTAGRVSAKRLEAAWAQVLDASPEPA